MNHISELGRLSLGSRLKRLSDYLITEVNAIYKANGINFEASSFPLLSLLEKYGPQSLRDAEIKLGTSHSYISQKAKYLQKSGLIEMRIDPNDARSKHMALSAQGIALIEKMQPIWKSLDIAFARLLGDQERKIFQELSNLETSLLRAGSLRQDVAKEMNSHVSYDQIEIVDYTDDLREKFCQLNLEWLEKSFVLQEFDHNVFSDPRKHIIEKGGAVFFAVMNGQAVGTAALYPEDKTSFELCKMGVDPRYRGHGIGRKMVEAGIEKARLLGAQNLTLLTHSGKLAPAVRLYKKLGFTPIPMTDHDVEKYGQGRVDLRMTLSLKKSKAA